MQFRGALLLDLVMEHQCFAFDINVFHIDITLSMSMCKYIPIKNIEFSELKDFEQNYETFMQILHIFIFFTTIILSIIYI